MNTSYQEFTVSKIDGFILEAVQRVDDANTIIQANYDTLSKYLSEEDQTRYAKLFVTLEDLILAARCAIDDSKE